MFVCVQIYSRDCKIFSQLADFCLHMHICTVPNFENNFMNMQEMADLQEQACWVILYVAAVSVGTSESIVKRGAVDSIIASMRSCDRHAGVQAQGWCVYTHKM
jgi:hypothetical protein